MLEIAMCGIVGILGRTDVSLQLIASLRRLEYRGYDSAGISTVRNGHLERRRAAGKIGNLEVLLGTAPIEGFAGIGHTRWATHGVPCERNAHPHMTARVSVVHNGIIENYAELRAELTADGYTHSSETDTEVVAHLVTREMDAGASPMEAVRQSLGRLRGAFALGMLFAGEDDLMIAARRGSPLALGYGHNEVYFGSDAIALAPLSDMIAYLEDGDMAVMSRAKVEVFDAEGNVVSRPPSWTDVGELNIEKGNHPDFMSKEIAEQPDAIARTLAHYFDLTNRSVRMNRLPSGLEQVRRVTITGCGTAHYAGQVAKYWLERYARIPVEIDVASEFRYREVPLDETGIAVVISQSGETADSLAAQRYCRSQGQRIVAIVNVPTSTIAREADVVLPLLAGPEIGVASTKAFTCQLTVLAALAIGAGKARGHISPEQEAELVEALTIIPRQIAEHLKGSGALYRSIGSVLGAADDVLFLGRGSSFPIALEGALKLKEISYIHAEGYAAGELKHGPIALVDDRVPVVVLAPMDDLYEKTVSNLQEVAARGGRVIFVSNGVVDQIGCFTEAAIPMPTVHAFVTPILYSLPMQLIAYHTARARGEDVDKPRNLAKSVTVE